MKKKYTKSLFIFRRDLRLEDNIGLAHALEQSAHVVPCFIFDPRQGGTQNSFRSMNAIQFMITSLKELDCELRKKKSALYLFYGDPAKIIAKLIKKEKIDAFFCNFDYTPFSLKRDEQIQKVCIQNQCAFAQYHDALLFNPTSIMTGSGTPYNIFGAYYKKAFKIPVAPPQEKLRVNFSKAMQKHSEQKKIFAKILGKYNNKNLHVKGGRKEALKLLKSTKNLTNYAKTHDYPALETSNLSAHLKFGTVSAREAYWHIRETLGAYHPLLRQLFWRDFFTYVAYHSPFVFGQPFHEKYKKLPWKNNIKDFKAWREGKTGFPIVDAGMRQLNTTGFMHNRVRMIVASFLVKDLHIDWQWGEKYFAQQLVDYDPCVNNGNWQWSASTGADAQPYFRIFNPWLQQKKFDKDCAYIKRWVPELKNLNPKILHTLYKEKVSKKNYPKPIVDHEKESRLAKQWYKGV